VRKAAYNLDLRRALYGACEVAGATDKDRACEVAGATDEDRLGIGPTTDEEDPRCIGATTDEVDPRLLLATLLLCVSERSISFALGGGSQKSTVA
jgi:hypothetical protein